MEIRPKRIHPFFSNEVEVINGYCQINALEGGWSILGEFYIE